MQLLNPTVDQTDDLRTRDKQMEAASIGGKFSPKHLLELDEELKSRRYEGTVLCGHGRARKRIGARFDALNNLKVGEVKRRGAE